ncbi:hypothetical protein KIPB_016340, partial [Kipferlia bialata]
LIEGDSSPSTATTESPTTSVSSDATEGERGEQKRETRVAPEVSLFYVCWQCSPACLQILYLSSTRLTSQVPCPHLVSAQGWANGGLEWQ